MRIDFCHSVSLWCNHSPFRGSLFLFSLFFHYASPFYASAIASATFRIVLPLVCCNQIIKFKVEATTQVQKEIQLFLLWLQVAATLHVASCCSLATALNFSQAR